MRLFGVLIGCFGGHLEFAISLIEQIFSFLSVTSHVKFVGLLGGDNLVISHLRVALRGGNIRMPCARNITDGFLCDGDSAYHKQKTENSG